MAHRLLGFAGMLATIASCTLLGIEALDVEVEVAIETGLPGYHVVGMPAPAVKEGGVRIRAALRQVGHDLPHNKVTVNLAPADVRKVGAAFDLSIAVGVLLAQGLYDPARLAGLLVLGELGLDGSLRKVRGALAAAMLARAGGLRGVLLPEASAAEAQVVDGIEVHAARHLGEVIAMLGGDGSLQRHGPAPRPAPRISLDMTDVRGQGQARNALEVAVAGGHNVLLTGPPGIGKTMLARRIAGILPPMSHQEALETTKIYSALGLVEHGLIAERPFRAPHHTVSTAALLGGGTHPRPGEISLAHNGVLFLDELPEFSRQTIEALRQPLEDRTITIGRINGTLRLPAAFLMVAAANPCPCGWAGSRVRECTCGPGAIERYRTRLSGPLLDRIDLQVGVRSVPLVELRDAAPGEASAVIRARVIEARERQQRRLARWGLRCNAEMPPAVMRATCRLDAAGEAVLVEMHAARRGMSARAVDRLLKVARTIADLSGDEKISRDHLLEASGYRSLEADPVVMPVGRVAGRETAGIASVTDGRGSAR